MGMLGQLRLHYKDVKTFGPDILRASVRGRSGALPRNIRTRFGNFVVRRSESDVEVLRQIFLHRDYDLDAFPQGKNIRAAYLNCIERGKSPIIIDAGANVGYASRFFAIAYPKANIVSIEPDPRSAEICRANALNFPQIEVIEAAIGAKEGFVSIEWSEGSSWASRTRPAQSGVPVTTINRILADRRDNGELLIAKIDIEGFEEELFASATEWVDQASAVIVEIHDWMLPGQFSSRSLQQCMFGKDRELVISGENLIWFKRECADAANQTPS